MAKSATGQPAVKSSVQLLKHGNRLVVDVPEKHRRKVTAILSDRLTFTEAKPVYGYARRDLLNSGRKPVELIRHELYDLDFRGRLATTYGFWKLITDELRLLGIPFKWQDFTPKPERPDVFSPVVDNIRHYQLREGQAEFISKTLSHRCGRIDCAPGFGKSFMIGIIAALLPKARIDVITRRIPVLRERIYPELIRMVGDVGIVGGGLRRTGHRVMCYSAASLRHAEADADIMFGDECHELAGDSYIRELPRWDMSRNYGLSASQDMRMDGKDLMLMGIFGPVIYKVDYQQAQAAGNVTPIVIHWASVKGNRGRYDDLDGVALKRHAIWRNHARNSAIAADARRYDDDVQVLITVDTIDHAMHLKKLLPEFALVHREESLHPADRRSYINRGCITEDEPFMSVKRRHWLARQFERGNLKKAIATPVWNVGVSFNQLSVLIRGEGSVSPINDIQIPGRTSRVYDGKECSVVHDYLDEFCVVR